MTTDPALLDKLRRMLQIASQVETGAGRLFQLDHAATLRETIAALERPLAGVVDGCEPSEEAVDAAERVISSCEPLEDLDNMIRRGLAAAYRIDLAPRVAAGYARGVEDAAKMADKVRGVAADAKDGDAGRSNIVWDARWGAAYDIGRSIRALLPNAPATEDAHYEPSDEEAYGAMIHRGKQEARGNGNDDPDY